MNTETKSQTTEPIAPSRDALVATIEEQLRSRLQAFDIKLGSKKALAIEGNFIPGAMAALQAVFPNEDPDKCSAMIPPKWVFAVMSGRSVLAPL